VSKDPGPDITQWPRVTKVLELTGISDFSKIRNAEFYLQRGGDIHMICESIDKGEPDYWSGSDLDGYAKAWIAFKAETLFVPDLIEHPVYHDLRRYKGTLDRTGKFPTAKKVLIDIKSGIVADWTALQTGAYAATFVDGDEYERYGVSLSATGKWKMTQFKDYRTDSNFFFSLVASLYAKEHYGKVVDYGD
jgi:hypothetical protein